MAKITFKQFLEDFEKNDPRSVPPIKTRDIRTKTDPRLQPGYQRDKEEHDKQFAKDPGNKTDAAEKLKSLFRSKSTPTGRGSHSASIAQAVGIYPA